LNHYQHHHPAVEEEHEFVILVGYTGLDHIMQHRAEWSIYCIIHVYTNRCDMMLEICVNWMEYKALQLL